MSMDKEKTTKILLKASDIEKGKDIALAREFVDIQDGFFNIENSISDLKGKIQEPIEIELIIE